MEYLQEQNEETGSKRWTEVELSPDFQSYPYLSPTAIADGIRLCRRRTNVGILGIFRYFQQL